MPGVLVREKKEERGRMGEDGGRGRGRGRVKSATRRDRLDCKDSKQWDGGRNRTGETGKGARGIDVLRFQRRPVVVSTVESMPTGRRPQVGPNRLWSMFMRCSPCGACLACTEMAGVMSEAVVGKGAGSTGMGGPGTPEPGKYGCLSRRAMYAEEWTVDTNIGRAVGDSPSRGSRRRCRQ